MNFLDLDVDVRLQIYSELLTLQRPIEFGADYGPSAPPLRWYDKGGLYPAILRVCKSIHHEAGPVLYAGNRFEFPPVMSGVRNVPSYAYIAPLFVQIGSSAGLIRHMTIPFPYFPYPNPPEAVLPEIHIEVLELIRTRTTTLKTLELLVEAEHSNYALSDREIASQALCLLDNQLKGIRTLKEIIVRFQEYPDREPDEEVTSRMRALGWTIRVERMPPRQLVSENGMIVFDNEEDCDRYDDECFRREEALAAKREEEEWMEDLHMGRRCWRDDPD